MAEQVLYHNFEEPEFPIHDVAKKLGWLPAYIDDILVENKYSSDRTDIFSTLIDTVLVFTRARTSVFHNMRQHDICMSLTSRLNSVLQAIDATHHSMELVRRGSNIFFITCSRRPRFIWKSRLTHREVGRNLDYFAAGHFLRPPFPPRGTISFVERESLTSLIDEIVYLDYVADKTDWERLVAFTSAKEALFNSVMDSLNLSFRFKWIFDCPEKHVEVSRVMKNPFPPSQEWWEKHCVWVDGFGNDDVVLEMGGPMFCNFNTRFREFWPLIQRTHQCIMEYRRVEFWEASQGEGYWKETTDLIGEIKETISNSTKDQVPDHVMDSISKRLERLPSTASSHIRHVLADISNLLAVHDYSFALKSSPPPNATLGRFPECELYDTTELVDNYKTKPRLVFLGVGAPPEEGKQLVGELVGCS